MASDLGVNLLRYTIKDKKFLLMDTETEGLNLFYDRPWSIGWLVCNGAEIAQKQHRYIWWPDLHISKGAAEKTRFDYRKYKEAAEDPRGVYKDFEPYLYNPKYIKLGHNILGIDTYMINTWRRGMGLSTDWSFIGQDTIDTHALAKGVKKGMQPTKPHLTWMYKMNSIVEKGLKTNLGLLARENDIKLDENLQHEAMYDCILNWEIFKKLIWQIEI